MNRLKNFILTNPTIIAILFFTIIYAIYKGSCLVMGMQNIYEIVMNIPITILKFCLSACIVIFLIKTKWVNPDVLSFYNTGKALIQGAFILAIIIIIFITTLITDKFDLSGFKIIQYILGLAAVGIFEEFFFRLGVLHILLKKWHTTSLDIKLVCFLSSCFFGIIHIGNLFLKEISLSYVVEQVIFAIGFGSFASAVYLRSRNIWGLVIIHALNDATIYTNGRNMKGIQINTTNELLSFLLLEALCILFWFIITQFILRKKKMKEILEASQQCVV